MREIGRRIINWKIWLVLLLLAALNGYGFFYLQSRDADTAYLRQVQSEKQQLLKAYLDSEEPETLREIYQARMQEAREQADAVAHQALREVLEDIEAAEAYPAYIDEVLKNAGQMKLIAALGQEDSFSVRNIDKTYADYEKCAGLSVQPVNAAGWCAVWNDPFTDYFLAVFCLFLATVFYQDKRSGLWTLQRSCADGRGKRIFFDVLAMLCWCILAVALCLGSLFLAAGYLYGLPDFSSPVQALNGYRNVTLPINIGTYLLCVAAVKAAVCFAAALLARLLYLLLRREGLVVLAYALALGGEIWLYGNISLQGNMPWPGVFNLWAGLCGDGLWRRYYNLNWFGQPLSVQSLFFPFLFIWILLAGTAVLLIEPGQYPRGERGKAPFSRIQTAISGCLTRGGIGVLEQYKLLICQRGLLIILLLFPMIFYSVSAGQLGYSRSVAYKNQVLEQIAGRYTQEKAAHVSGLLEEQERLYAEYEDQLSRYSYETEPLAYQSVTELKRCAEERIGVLEELQAYLQYLASENARGRSVRIVNDNGYQMLFGISGASVWRKNAFYLLLFLTLLFGGAGAYENQVGMRELTAASDAGNHTVFRRKWQACMVWTFAASVLSSFTEWYQIGRQLPLKEPGAMLQSLPMFMGTSVSMRIWQLILLLAIGRLAVSVLLMTGILFLSSKFRSVGAALAAAVLLFVVPSFLYGNGAVMLKPVALLEYLCAQKWLIPLL